MTMDSATFADSYSEVIRLDDDFRLPPSHTFVSTSSPILVQQLSRELTLARGRILYEVCDSWDGTVIGYVVPSDVAAVASHYKQCFSTNVWDGLPVQQHDALRHAYKVLKQQYPRMPIIAAIRVAEKAEREKWNGERRSLEAMVVEHVLHEWTSYDLRLDYFYQYNQRPSAWSGLETFRKRSSDYQKRLSTAKKQASNVVKTRMREVLQSWLSEDTRPAALSQFWRRHELLSAVAEDGDDQVQGTMPQMSLLAYGGCETLANIMATVQTFS